MSTSRIDELRSKFEENPRRYFAPLANEYRKAGDLTTAIALCREHLPKQPGHMSGHIVYGQALFEANALEESRQVFEAALALDPENLIALRHLVDIARADGDSRLARRWYERMLDVDPHNDEIAHQLSSLATPAAPVASVPDVAASPVVPSSESAMHTPTVPFDGTLFAPMATPDAAQRAVDEPLDLEMHGAIDDPVDLPVHAVLDEPLDLDVQNAVDEPRGVDGSPDLPLQSAIDEPRDFDRADAQAIDDAFADVDAIVLDDYAATVGDDQEEIHGLVSVDALIEHIEQAEPIDIGDALDAFDAHDPGVELDPAIGGTPMAAADVDAPPSLSTHDYSAAFEEGLIAPEWPDTADLVARVEHPPEIAAVTPAYSQDAVSAFGRETVDPEPVPEPDEIEYGERDVVGSDVNFEDDAQADAVSGDADDTQSFVAADESVSAVVAEDVEPPVVAEVEPPVVAEVEPPAVADVDPLDAADELPWISASDAPAEVQEVARALSRDARASGETEAIRIEMHDGSEVDDDASNGSEDSQFASVDSAFANDVSDTETGDEPATNDESVRSTHDSPAFVTETMAELLIAQGFIERAATVYEELVRRRPHDPVLSARLGELRERLAQPEATADVAADEAQDMTAVSAAEDHEPVEAVGLSVDDDTHDEPHEAAQSPAVPTPIIAPLAIAYDDDAPRLTARQRFAKLATRRVPRRTPPRAAVVVDSPADGLAGLFGGTDEQTPDEFAARAFADAFAPMDEPPFGASNHTPVFVTRTITAPSAPAVLPTLSPATPSSAPAATPAKSGFSFDRFFPDPATVSPTPPASAAAQQPGEYTTPAQSPPVSDDLAEFAAWLKGLDKP